MSAFGGKAEKPLLMLSLTAFDALLPRVRSNKLVASYQNYSKCKLRVDPQIHPNEIGGRVRFIRWVKP
jgi:hypothetical protein